MDGTNGYREYRELLGLPSIEAFDLHGHATSHSVRLGVPGFVSDRQLDGLTSDTTLPAVELCLIGLWERTEHGYAIRDPDLVDLLIHAHAHADDRAGAAMICALEGHVAVADRACCPRCLERVDPGRRDAAGT